MDSENRLPHGSNLDANTNTINVQVHGLLVINLIENPPNQSTHIDTKTRIPAKTIYIDIPEIYIIRLVGLALGLVLGLGLARF